MAPVGDPWAAHIRKEILDSFHPWQGDAFHDPSKRKAGCIGRGGGKTTLILGQDVIEMAETTKGKWIYACPTLGMAIDLLWEPLKELCSRLGLEQGIDCEFKEAPREGGKIFYLKTGSRLKLFGADDKKQINLCRGQWFNGVDCDEVGFWPSPEVLDNFVTMVIEPRIGERNGRIGMWSSPGLELRGIFFNATSEGSEEHRPYSKRDLEEYADWMPEQWSSHHWNLADVTGIRNEGDEPDPEVVKRYPALVALRRSHLQIFKARSWDEKHPVRRREYDGLWSADNTTTVFQFDPALNLWKPIDVAADATQMNTVQLKQTLTALPKGRTYHFVLAGDKGSPRADKKEKAEGKKRAGDPYAFNVFAFAPSDPTRVLWHVYFYERRGMYARPIAQLALGPDDASPTGCKPHAKPDGILGAIGWPDGMVIDADEALIAELSNVYGLRFEKADKRPEYKAGEIELTNGELGAARIRVIENSPLHRQLTGVQWQEQANGALKENPSQANHSTDTLIYGGAVVRKMFDSGVVTPAGEGDSEQAAAYADPMGLGADADPGGGSDGLFDSWMHGNDDDWEPT